MTRSKPAARPRKTKAVKSSLTVGEFKAQSSRVLERLRARQKPIVLTEKGRPAAVLVPPDEFERLSEHDRFIDAVREGLADSEADRVIDDDALAREIAAEFEAPKQP